MELVLADLHKTKSELTKLKQVSTITVDSMYNITYGTHVC